MKKLFILACIPLFCLQAVERFPQSLLNESARKHNLEFAQRRFEEISHNNPFPGLHGKAIAFIQAMANNGKKTGPIGSRELAKRLEQKAQSSINDVLFYSLSIKQNMKTLFPIKQRDKEIALFRLGFLPEDMQKCINEFGASRADNKEEALKASESQNARDKERAYDSKKRELDNNHACVQAALAKALIAQYAVYLHNKIVIDQNSIDMCRDLPMQLAAMK